MPPVLALVDDLMFLSRIREAARGAGVEVVPARDVQSVLEAVRDGSRLLLLDLDSDRLPWAEALAAVRNEPATEPPLRAIGFFGHVHPERARQALSAGCTQALPRSAFVRELPTLLADV